MWMCLRKLREEPTAMQRVWVVGMDVALLGGAWADAAALPLTWVMQSSLGHM